MNTETQQLIQTEVAKQIDKIKTEYGKLIEDLQAQIKQERIARMQAEEKLEAARRTSGQGSLQSIPKAPTKELLQSVLVPKVEMTSLEEVCKVESERRGGDRFYRRD